MKQRASRLLGILGAAFCIVGVLLLVEALLSRLNHLVKPLWAEAAAGVVLLIGGWLIRRFALGQTQTAKDSDKEFRA